MSNWDSGTKVVLYDTEANYRNLLPLSYTRPVGAFRVGIDTLADKWKAMLPGDYQWLTRPCLREKFPGEYGAPGEECVYIAGNVLADTELVQQVKQLEPGHGLADADGLWAWRGTYEQFLSLTDNDATDNIPTGVIKERDERIADCDTRGRRISYVFDIFLKNEQALLEDYHRYCYGRKSNAPDDSTRIIGPMYQPDGTPSIMIEEGATVIGATLNVTGGPIYIGKDCQVMEGACLRGPIAMLDGTRVRMGAKIYGGTTFGPNCRIGGEVDNTVIFGYSNKAHDGYLGNAVIGEWCNLGAGCNASNLKNDYTKIRVWNYARRGFMKTDLQFCGLIMGDHSKAAINTMFNTATVVGVGVNFHGAGFPRPFIPSFQTGSPAGFTDVSVDQFFKVAAVVMGRRGIELTDVDRRMFEFIHKSAAEFKR